MQIIIVRVIPETRKKPVRMRAVTATGIKGRIASVDDFDPKYEGYDVAARNAAKELAAKLDWSGNWHGGLVEEGEYMVFVMEAPNLSFAI